MLTHELTNVQCICHSVRFYDLDKRIVKKKYVSCNITCNRMLMIEDKENINRKCV